MKRPLLNKPGRLLSLALSAVSLLLCLAALAMWVRGLVVVDVFHRVTHHQRAAETRDDSIRITTGRGVVAVNLMTSRQPRTYPQRYFDREGRVRVQTEPEPYPDWHRVDWSHTTMAPDRLHLLRRNVWEWLGFNWRSTSRPVPGGGMRAERAFRVPYWLVVALLAAPPLLALRNLRHRRRRRASGLCESCGYDLRATPGRCPECGKPFRRGLDPVAAEPSLS